MTTTKKVTKVGKKVKNVPTRSSSRLKKVEPKEIFSGTEAVPGKGQEHSMAIGHSTDQNPKVILLDIEGTTTSINFVKKELFPFITANIEKYLTDNWTIEAELPALLMDLRAQFKSQPALNEKQDAIPEFTAKDFTPPNPPNHKIIVSICSYIHHLMQKDSKLPPLKRLQGIMWRKAYEDGLVVGHIYDDVLAAIERWRADGYRICIYSSGSIEAQKLLFKHTSAGDLTPLFDAYYDTTIGLKTNTESYKSIALDLKVPAKDIMFLSDNILENWAAREAGMMTVNVEREGNAPIEERKGVEQICTFEDLNLKLIDNCFK